MLVACQSQNNAQDNTAKEQQNTQTSSDSILISNITDKESFEEIKTVLLKHLDKNDVDKFLSYITDYNETIENTSLNSQFKVFDNPQYDMIKIDSLWQSKKGDFIGTNCRINTFTLLQHLLKFDDKTDNDTSLLFMDLDAIKFGNLLDNQETLLFNRLFGKVKTEHTKDVNVHLKNMQDHFKGLVFNDNVKMISVIIHDDLDGDFLFIGHTGVLLENKDGYIFVEKLSLYRRCFYNNENGYILWQGYGNKR